MSYFQYGQGVYVIIFRLMTALEELGVSIATIAARSVTMAGRGLRLGYRSGSYA